MPPRLPNSAASDHDLLIRIDTKVDTLQATLQETRTALSARIDLLAREKANSTDLDPLRHTIETLQQKVHTKASQADHDNLAEKFDQTRRLVWIGVGILVAINLIAPVVWAKLLN